jgi:hypothetical protein
MLGLWARRRVPVPRARERATSCSGGGVNNLAASSTHRQPLLPTGSVTTIVTVVLRNRAVSGIGCSVANDPCCCI